MKLLGAALLLVALATWMLPPTPLYQPPKAAAQSAQPGIALYPLGSQAIANGSWSFSGEFAVTAGAWESVTISNYGYCFVGPNDPRAGTAHAGGIFWFGELEAQPPQAGGYMFSGTLSNGRGGTSGGTVTVTSNGDPSNPSTQIDASLSGSDLSYFAGDSLTVCLLGSS